MHLGHTVITGGSGFIGTHLVARALEHSRSVTVVDLESRSHPSARHISANIADRSALSELFQTEIDTIFHLAARTSVLESVKDPQGVFETNVVGTQNMLELAREVGARRILIASTNAVVGNHPQGRITELSPLRPLTPYGATKAAGEVLANAYCESYHISATQLRLTNVYGEGMAKKDSIIPRLMRTALGLAQFSIYGDGEQFRDYVYAGDVADAFIELARIGHQGPVIIGTGSSITVNALLHEASIATGIQIPYSHSEAKPGEMRGVSVDNSLASSLGITCRVGIEEGLARTWTDFKSLQQL